MGKLKLLATSQFVAYPRLWWLFSSPTPSGSGSPLHRKAGKEKRRSMALMVVVNRNPGAPGGLEPLLKCGACAFVLQPIGIATETFETGGRTPVKFRSGRTW